MLVSDSLLSHFILSSTSCLRLQCNSESAKFARVWAHVPCGALDGGLYINRSEAGRMSVNQANAIGHVYMSAFREFAGEAVEVVFEMVVDSVGNGIDALPPTSLINHACDPNLTVIPVRVDSLVRVRRCPTTTVSGVAVEKRICVAARHVVDSFQTMIRRRDVRLRFCVLIFKEA
uniref:Histone lysine N methyltransferase SETMAR n=1 Tax=Echinococcus granulosus TaxID=6210 RepID=A0A068WLT5_ECHGR|nr:histone lysine N methyltransferase SETMAR [Echinococcus granulosus]